MNKQSNQPEGDGELSPFEQKLQRQVLGPSPSNRGELMFQCGYAAGATDTRKKSQASTLRWQVVGLAASAIASLSISAHFIPRNDAGYEQVVVDQPEPPTDQKGESTEYNSTNNAWTMYLTRKREVDQQSMSALRNTGVWHDNKDSEGEGGELKELPPSTSESPLRPSDFPIFL